jgi:hypothetical protein
MTRIAQVSRVRAPLAAVTEHCNALTRQCIRFNVGFHEHLHCCHPSISRQYLRKKNPAAFRVRGHVLSIRRQVIGPHPRELGTITISSARRIRFISVEQIVWNAHDPEKPLDCQRFSHSQAGFGWQ